MNKCGLHFLKPNKSGFLNSNSVRPLPKLNPGLLPSYITLGKTRFDGPLSMRDPEVERAEKASGSTSVPAPPIRPAELTKSGKPLTKKEKREVLSYLPLHAGMYDVNIIVTAKKQN